MPQQCGHQADRGFGLGTAPRRSRGGACEESLHGVAVQRVAAVGPGGLLHAIRGA